MCAISSTTVLDTFAVVGDPLPSARACTRADGLVDRFSVSASDPAPLEPWDPLAAEIR